MGWRVWRTCWLVVAAMLLYGCIFRPAAPSVLHFRNLDAAGSPEVTFGIREVHWKDDNGKIMIVGRGWHYREHETYPGSV